MKITHFASKPLKIAIELPVDSSAVQGIILP